MSTVCCAGCGGRNLEGRLSDLSSSFYGQMGITMLACAAFPLVAVMMLYAWQLQQRRAVRLQAQANPNGQSNREWLRQYHLHYGASSAAAQSEMHREHPYVGTVNTETVRSKFPSSVPLVRCCNDALVVLLVISNS